MHVFACLTCCVAPVLSVVCVQAMDRCHRIGQDRPVLVFRLATSHSVEGKMLRRACDKMALERLVIKKGVFKEVLDMEGADGDKVR